MKALKVSSGKGHKYGHVPGHQYLDVDVTIIRTRRGKWTVEILETWGSCQGYDEEHGRKKVIGRGNDLASAAGDARRRAHEAAIHAEYTAQALSCAEADAAEEMDAADETEAPLADVSTEQLQAELARRCAG